MAEGAYFLKRDGAAAKAIREFDWSQSPLGSLADWPSPLKVAADLMLHSEFPKALVWGPELITLHNDAFRIILGEKPPAIGHPFSDVWTEAWHEISPIVDRALRGEATFIENYPLLIDRHGYPEQAYFTFCFSPVHDETGAVAGMMDTVIETTSTVSGQKQLQAINSELAHRMRNLISVAKAMTTQSLRFHTDIKSTVERLNRRFGALAQVQTVLNFEHKNSADLRVLIENAIAPHPKAESRICVSGPALQLREQQATALSLALNELITNALKYGALSKKVGQVEVFWTIANEEFAFIWNETGGPAVSSPAKTGYGSELIEQYVAATFSGRAHLTFDPEGVRYELRAPLAALKQSPEGSTPAHS